MIKVLIWNVQEFGDWYVDKAGARTTSQNLLATLIADLDADVVIMQELRENGVAWLPGVTQALNMMGSVASPVRKWNFDWIPSGTQSGSDRRTLAFRNMTFRVGNREGYAVLWWRRVAELKVEPPRSGGVGNMAATAGKGSSFIDACLRSYRLVQLDRSEEPRIGRKAPPSEVASISGWPRAPMPRAFARTQQAWLARLFVRHYSRRGAFVTVNSDVPTDIVVYHAPNDATLYGPVMAMNAVTDNEAQIIGGDWNTTKARDLAGVARTAAAYKMRSPMIAEDGTVTGEPSMVHSCGDRDNSPWYGTTLNKSPFTSSRDFAVVNRQGDCTVDVTNVFPLFYQRAPRSWTYRYLSMHRDAVRALVSDGWPERKNVTAKTIVDAFFAALDTYAVGGADPVRAATGNVADFSTGIALLYEHFVSDHLPLLVTLPDRVRAAE